MTHSVPRVCALLRVRRLLALGRRHTCLRLRRRPAPRDKHGFPGPTDLLRQGVHSLAGGPRRRRRWPGRSRCPAHVRGTTAARRNGGIPAALKQGSVLRLTPNAHCGGSGAKPIYSLISVAERNQHRHSMTPGRLAAVKDRGCPPILTCCGYRLASKNRLPPRPLAKRRQRVRAAVPDCLTPASLRWASFISVMRDNSFWRLS